MQLGKTTSKATIGESIILTSELYQQLNIERRLSVTNLSSENNFADVSTECSSRHQGEVKEVRNNVAIYSHALPRIHIIGGQRSVRIAPPSLPLHHTGPATKDFQSFSELKLVTELSL